MCSSLFLAHNTCAVGWMLTCCGIGGVWCVGNCGQHWCSECRKLLGSNDRHTQCKECRSQPPSEQENIDPLAQIGENATQLMASLPIHSHHRAPLLSILSHNIPSTTASSLLHASASYIRNVKRKDCGASDLVQQSYAAGVKRQKTSPLRQDQLCDFIATACPTKSGERTVTYHQYITDDSLYAGYCKSTPTPVSFNTFWK